VSQLITAAVGIGSKANDISLNSTLASLRGCNFCSFSVLTPNIRGYQSAVEAIDKKGDIVVDEVAVFGSVSEGFSQKNINCSVEESVERFQDVVKQAREDGRSVR